MDEEVKRRLTRHFGFCEEEGEHFARLLYRACKNAYMAAGRPCGEGDRAMMLWVEYGRGSTVN